MAIKRARKGPFSSAPGPWHPVQQKGRKTAAAFRAKISSVTAIATGDMEREFNSPDDTEYLPVLVVKP